jgi:PAS domain S-box-containing protein
VTLAGIGVLIGWFFDLAPLRGEIGSLMPVAPAAAIGFAFGGVSLLSSRTGVRRDAAGAWIWLGRFCAAGVAGIGLVGIIRLLDGLNPVSRYLAAAGRIEPAMAATFIVLGGALLMLNLETATGWRPAQLLALAAAIPVFLVDMSPDPAVLSTGWRLSPHAGVLSALLSVGLLSAHPTRGMMGVATSRSAGGSLVRRMTVLSVVMVTALVWASWFAQVAVTLTLVSISILVAAVWLIAGKLHRTDSERQLLTERLEQSQRNMEDQARQLSAKLSQAEEWWAREEALRVKAEQDLHMARGDLLEVFDNQLVGLYWVAPEGTITDANKAELELLGYSEQEYIGHHIAEFYVDQEVAAEVIGKVQRGESIAQEARLRSHDGSMRYVLMNSKPPAAGGVSARTLFVACDVTERKRIESELAQLLAREHAMRAMAEDAEIRYHNLVHGLDAIVWEADAADFRFLFVSRRGEAILGYPVQRWLGDPDFWASIIHPDDRQQAVEQCRRTASEGEDERIKSWNTGPSPPTAASSGSTTKSTSFATRKAARASCAG